LFVCACPVALASHRVYSASSSLPWLLATMKNAMRCPYKEPIRPTNGRAQPM
jgi:hypothetical protein